MNIFSSQMLFFRSQKRQEKGFVEGDLDQIDDSLDIITTEGLNAYFGDH